MPRSVEGASRPHLEIDHQLADPAGGVIHRKRLRRRGLDETIARLLVHGVLHLLGHDHEEDDEARRMQAEERRIWRVLRA